MTNDTTHGKTFRFKKMAWIETKTPTITRRGLWLPADRPYSLHIEETADGKFKVNFERGGKQFSSLDEVKDAIQSYTETRLSESILSECNVETLSGRVQILEEALRRIAKWKGEFPSTGQAHDGGEPMSYSFCYGSNGERDFMRGIATDALNGIKTNLTQTIQPD